MDVYARVRHDGTWLVGEGRACFVGTAFFDCYTRSGGMLLWYEGSTSDYEQAVRYVAGYAAELRKLWDDADPRACVEAKGL